nr:putative DNA-binding transcriptional regulator [Klebsiella pneumoniae]
MLYQDRVQMYCRAGHPALDGPQDETTLAEYEFALLLPEGQRYPPPSPTTGRDGRAPLRL